MNVEGLIPLIVPFIIGLLAGVVIKRVIRLGVVIAALVIALVATGYASFGFERVKEKALELLPRVMSTGRKWLRVLPYSSGAFLVGFALGLWSG